MENMERFNKLTEKNKYDIYCPKKKVSILDLSAKLGKIEDLLEENNINSIENLKEYIDGRLEEVYLETCRFYELDLEKINSIDDCKKILKFLCNLILKPTPNEISYNGFDKVEQYFKK